MLERIKLSILLQGLTLLVPLGPACEASSLGLTVHVLPLDSDGGNTVRAHFSAIAPTPCPALTGLCAAGEDCLVHTTSLPFTGTKPSSGWCVRQWQKTVPSNYNATIKLGSDTEIYVSMKAGPQIRGNSGRLNHPAFVGLFPPLRARVNCPHHFHLSVKDLDGDKVRCRFARPEEAECVNCTQHSFIELEEDQCSFTFTGKAAAGRYFIHLMAEDMIPTPRTSHTTANKPLSSVPVHLSLTVEESTSSCSSEPVATDETPRVDSTLFVLPYQQAQFDVEFESQQESILEFGAIGPPGLLRVGFKTIGPLATMTMSWVRSENKLARLLPICFAANTRSLQSEPRCVWLYQREMTALPAGTELTCEKTAMTLLLPITSLSDIDLTELQLNSPTCPVTYNSTHLTARISLTGCGTKIVHSGNEMVFTNTLKTVRAYTLVSRRPMLVLPLACRIPEAQVGTPHYQIGMPKEEEVFGVVDVWIEIHAPGEGPLAEFTRTPRFRTLRMAPGRVRREAQSPSESNSTSTSSTDNSTSTSSTDNSTTNTHGAVGSRITQLDLHVMSNCSIERAEMIMSNCIESATEDFAETFPILEQGCVSSNKTLEVITTKSNSKVYRLDLSSIETKGSTMYIECTVNLCIATMPSEKCPDLCVRSFNHRALVGSLFTGAYTIRSGPISLVVTSPAPTTTAVAKAPTTAAATTTAAAAAAATTITTAAPISNTTSGAPEQASAMAAGVILTTFSIFLQNIFLY